VLDRDITPLPELHDCQEVDRVLFLLRDTVTELREKVAQLTADNDLLAEAYRELQDSLDVNLDA
jgi:hypothetical protein